VSALPGDLVIRHATIADVEPLRSYTHALFAERLPGIYRRTPPTIEDEVEFVRSHTEPANSALFVATSGDEVVGLLDFVGGSLSENAHAGVFGISVASGMRGCGLGTRLVAELLDWAPTVGIRRVEVRCFSTNPRALALYRRLGFTDEGCLREAVSVDGESVDVFVLARLLNSAHEDE
jgi:RimJ/RimL family protein N-acetyltransferase